MRATGDSMISAPPLVMTRSEAEEFVSLAKKCIDEFARELGRL
jgi:putrescine aminotransferase